MKFFKSNWFLFGSIAILLLALCLELILNPALKNQLRKVTNTIKSFRSNARQPGNTSYDSLVSYGKELIINTATYLGPHGKVAHISNGLNCGNCHLDGGTKLYTNNFFAVLSTYPKFRARSGKYESIEFRINECLQRSLDGKAMDSLQKEMKAMVAYLKWVGKDATKNFTPAEMSSNEVPYLPVAADPVKGAITYQSKCIACHGKNGEGISKDSFGYVYPPVWGKNCYNVSSGMYRITRLASFVKYNMPIGATFKSPLLTDEEAWNVSAYINSQPHPYKIFYYDWPVLSTKPVDYPYGPYADTFTEKQHKYGPYAAMKKTK